MTQSPNNFHGFYVAAYTIVAAVHITYVISLVVRSRRAAERLRSLRSRAATPTG